MDRVGATVVVGCVALLGLAGALVTTPALLGPLGPLLLGVLTPALDFTGLALVVVGISVGVVGAVIASSERRARPARADLEAVLGGVRSTTAGASLDDRVRQVLDTTDADDRADREAALRTTVRETAVTVLTRSRGLGPEEASERLETGEWTVDPQAAAYFSGRPPPLLIRLREWLGTRSGVEQRLERVVAELEALLAIDDPRPGDDALSAAQRGGTTAPTALEGAVHHRLDPGTAGPDDRAESTVRVATATGDTVTSVGDSQRFGLTVGLVSVAVGLVTNVTSPFLLGFLGVAYSLVTTLTGGPPAPDLTLTRRLASDSPVPGDLVDVELVVENVGESPVADLRVVDAPPSALRVVDGSPSMATSLRSGETATLTYTLRAKRGSFTFGETHVVLRDLANVTERAVTVTVPMRLSAATRLDDLGLVEQASRRIGTVKTDSGGSGVEFYGTREYRPGDPMNRVNWNHLAKTGELTTVEFREQRAPTVAIVLDQREAARLAPTASALDGVDLAVYAAEQAFLALFDAGTEVGLVTYGERLTTVDPASDAAQRALVQSRLRAATDRYAAALGESAVDATGAVFQRPSPEPAMVDRHVPRNAQVLVLSPATDDFALEVTERLAAAGRPVTLLSPAMVGAATIGDRHRRLDRACRLEAIRDQGTRVVDWHPSEPVQIAIARATEAVGRP